MVAVELDPSLTGILDAGATAIILVALASHVEVVAFFTLGIAPHDIGKILGVQRAAITACPRPIRHRAPLGVDLTAHISPQVDLNVKRVTVAPHGIFLVVVAGPAHRRLDQVSLDARGHLVSRRMDQAP